MLSKGTFLNLYSYGYDVPEAYAIQKDGKMYYAFFAPEWKGQIELRGLGRGGYRIVDYENGKELGKVHGPTGSIDVQFEKHLLIRANPE